MNARHLEKVEPYINAMRNQLLIIFKDEEDN
jgi:hypothetical protein